ncbi:MAG: hypothetical protein K0Q83_2530 [Deltaproteobacteria bacterium]|nr:hypothetical protein [Deltaproteobacteria bacterium]
MLFFDSMAHNRAARVHELENSMVALSVDKGTADILSTE